jgi:hypothetical protein
MLHLNETISQEEVGYLGSIVVRDAGNLSED